MYRRAEYIWLDGNNPQQLRSKTKVLQPGHKIGLMTLADYEVWGFDGSSTKQAQGEDSDCVLKPVGVYKDPTRAEGSVLVLNEVLLPNGEIHPTNTRRSLEGLARELEGEEYWFGIEQEYTLFREKNVLGFPKGGFPEKQGKYYCGIGSGKAYGRELVEAHLDAMIDAKLMVSGINAEVMPGQWEFQIGAAGPLRVADDLMVARYLLDRLAEREGIEVSYSPKPVQGDWNGAGAHTNFSTKQMRENGGFDEVIAKLEAAHVAHIDVYGVDNEYRLTGDHETCSIHDFKAGVSDRGASVRIPWQVAKDGKGYLEDRRPAANMDPYTTLATIMRTVSSK